MTLPLDSKALKGVHLGGEPAPQHPPGARHRSQESGVQVGQGRGFGGGSRGQSPKEQSGGQRGGSWRGQRGPCPLLGHGRLPEAGPSGLRKPRPTGEVLEREAQTWVPRTTAGSWVPGGPSSALSLPLPALPKAPACYPNTHSLPGASPRPLPPGCQLHPHRLTLPPQPQPGHCPGCPLTLPDSPGPPAVQPSPHHDRERPQRALPQAWPPLR